jgi:hypothetical protein
VPAGARQLPCHRDVDGALWVTVPVPAAAANAPPPVPASRLDGAAAAADPAAAAAAALAAAGPMPTPLAPLGGCDRKFVPPSPQKPCDFEGVAPDADARRALLGVPLGSQGGGSLSQGAMAAASQPMPSSQPMSPDGGGARPMSGRGNPAAASLHRLPPSARASPVAIKPSPFKDRVDAATAAVVRKQRSLFQQQPNAAAAAEAAAAAAAAGGKVAAPAPPLPSRDRGIGGIPGSQEVPDI